jgi:adenosine deaminase
LTWARSQNVLYTEMFIDPQAHTARGVSYDTVIQVQEEVNLDKAGIVQRAENAIESAWLPGATKDRYIAELKAYAG